MGAITYSTITVLLIDAFCVGHIFRTGRSLLWMLPIIVFPVLGAIGYFLLAILPDMLSSREARRFADNVVSAADPGRAFREKTREVERVGSVDSKRALAEECIKMGRFAEAVALYESAMQGPLGASDPALLKGLGRAQMLSGNGAAAERFFLQLKALDPAAFDADAELDYARALVLEGKTEAAVRQYENIVQRYPGEEARCRFALLLESEGQEARAQALFREILASVKASPSYYRSRQREWTRLARQHLKS